MQTSYTPTDWHEDDFESRLRSELNKASAPGLVRKLYPLRAKLLSKDGAYGFPTGHIFQYARTKDKLSTFPIEMCVLHEPRNGGYWNCTIIQHYKSVEVEIMRAED